MMWTLILLSITVGRTSSLSDKGGFVPQQCREWTSGHVTPLVVHDALVDQTLTAGHETAITARQTHYSKAVPVV
jgi:hypothetical protein